MATTVSALDGIKYGFKLLAYYLVISVIGGAVMAFGFGLASAELAVALDSFRQPNLFILLFGSVISMVGVSILYAGTLGVGYKVIADAVYTGNIEAADHSGSGSSGGSTTASTGANTAGAGED